MDWADEQVKAVRENMPLSIKEFDEAFSAALRKAKADGWRECAEAMENHDDGMACGHGFEHARWLRDRAARVEQPR